MSIHESNGVVCIGRRVNSGTPDKPLQYGASGCFSESQKDAATQISKNSRVTWAGRQLNSKDVFASGPTGRPHPASARADVRQKRDGCFRSKSAKCVLQYADIPIEITNHHLGRPTRASILRNLKRTQSASAVCSEFSWIQDNRRLCNIRDYYRLYNAEKITCKTPNGEPIHKFLTGARFNNGKWLDSDSVKEKGVFIDRQNLRNVFLFSKPPRDEETKYHSKKCKRNLLEIQGKGILKDANVNTDDNFLSLNKWHGATWQRNLPQLYQPTKEKYNSHASVVVRAKRVKSEYRNPMAFAKEKKSWNTC